jgi:hypothetical protein
MPPKRSAPEKPEVNFFILKVDIGRGEEVGTGITTTKERSKACLEITRIIHEDKLEKRR